MKKPFVSSRILRLAENINAKVVLEPEYGFAGHITFANGQTSFFKDSALNINELGSVQIAKDKGFSSYFLRLFGFNVPDWHTVFNDKLNENISIKRNIMDGYKLAKEMGFPVIVKPNDKSKGEGVYKVYNRKEYFNAAKEILNNNSVMLVQEFCNGNDYRIVVLNGEIISAYQRKPLAITGDGKSTVKEILLKIQSYFEIVGRDTKIDISDSRLHHNLKRQKVTLDSILPDQKELVLLDNANLSSGGTAFDFTDTIHEDYKRLAISVSSKMCLHLCGVDILTSDITQPIRNYKIIEINAAPGLDNYAFIGEKQNKRVDELYLKILVSLQAKPHPY